MGNAPASVVQFKDWQGLARKLAWSFRKMLARRGHQLSFDEAYSEVCLIWCAARDGFKPELGFSFATYFTRCAMNGAGVFHKAQREQRQSDASLRLDAPSYLDDETSIRDRIEDDSLRHADDICHTKRRVETVSLRTPMIGHMLSLMQQEPDDLVHELRAAHAQRAYAKQIGSSCHETTAPRMLTPKVLGRIFRFNWKQRLRLMQEIEEASNHVQLQ